MRHILQEIFERYLNADLAAFDAAPRELWPTDRYALKPRSASSGNDAGRGREPAGGHNVYRDREPRP